MDTQQTLSTDKLSIGYTLKGKSPIAVASGLDLRLNRGEFVCLLGANGSGKSTLIRTLSGMSAPLNGQVAINGYPLNELSAKERARQMSVVLTDNLSIGMMTGYALVSLGRHPYTNWAGSLSDHDRKRIDWALDAVKCKELAHRQIGELSDGERQKFMIARALAQDASIMLLDEPTAYLDLPRRVELMRILRDLAHQENLSILVSTHDLELAQRGADRLWLYNEDKSLTQGPPEELALNGSIAKAFASDKLDWDTELGSFRMHRDPCAYVAFSGDGPAAIWTQRALARIGYGIDSDPARCAFSIEVGDHWIVHYNGLTERFSALSEFMNWLQNKTH